MLSSINLRIEYKLKTAVQNFRENHVCKSQFIPAPSFMHSIYIAGMLYREGGGAMAYGGSPSPLNT